MSTQEDTPEQFQMGFKIEIEKLHQSTCFQVPSLHSHQFGLNYTKMVLMTLVTRAIAGCLTWLNSFLCYIVNDSACHGLSQVLSEGTFRKGQSLSRNQHPRLGLQSLLGDLGRKVISQTAGFGGHGSMEGKPRLTMLNKSKEAGDKQECVEGRVLQDFRAALYQRDAWCS